MARQGAPHKPQPSSTQLYLQGSTEFWGIVHFKVFSISFTRWAPITLVCLRSCSLVSNNNRLVSRDIRLPIMVQYRYHLVCIKCLNPFFLFEMCRIVNIEFCFFTIIANIWRPSSISGAWKQILVVFLWQSFPTVFSRVAIIP